MVMHNMHTLDVLFVILPVLAVLWLVFRRGTGRISRSRAPRPWHPAVRIVCGVLGIGLLIALGVGTWREVRGVYGESLQTPQPALHLPAKPSPALPTPTQALAPGGARISPLSEARVLFHMVLLQRAYPIHAEELDVRFPEDAGKKLERSFEHGGVHYRVTLTLKGLVAPRGFNDSPAHLFADGDINLEAHVGGSSWGSGPGGLIDLSSKYELERGVVNPWKQPWSLVHPAVSAPVLVLQACRVDRDDPLKPATLVEVAGSNESADPNVPSGSRLTDPDMPPAYRLMEALGVSSIILIFAAALLAQVFVRRGLAFAGLLALCMGYAAVLDRLAMGFHSGKLADKQQPMEDRVMAAEALRGTYFYKDTARRAAEWPVSVKP